jgi:hypothetical protein
METSPRNKETGSGTWRRRRRQQQVRGACSRQRLLSLLLLFFEWQTQRKLFFEYTLVAAAYCFSAAALPCLVLPD